MAIFLTILILFLGVSLSGILFQMLPFQLPLPLVQILLGALIPWSFLNLSVEFDPELFLVLFIPPLLFADGRKTPIREFLHHGREIIGLALVLVLLTVVGMGFFISFLIPSMPLVVCFALAAILSPTDAVALSGIVGKDRIPRYIMSILEGEALMNDASGLVSLKFALKVALGTMMFETASDYSDAAIEFVKVALGGIAMGIIITWLFRRAFRIINRYNIDDPTIQILFLLLLPFSSYLVAEHFEMSGILAAVAAGMMAGNSKGLTNVPLAVRLQSNSVWSTLEFVLNGLVFIMLGSQIPPILDSTMNQLHTDDSITAWLLFGDIIIIYSGLLIMRFLWLYSMRFISQKFAQKKPLAFNTYTLRDLLISTFAGVRGAITLAGALSIPLFLDVDELVPFPSRYQLVFLAMGVILFSLICGVLVLPFLLRGITSVNGSKLKEEEELASKEITTVAIDSLEKLYERLEKSSEEDIDPHTLAEISAKVISSLRQSSILEKESEMKKAEALERRFRLTALRAQRGELYHLRAQQKISNETMERMIYELDLIEALLTSR